MLQKDAARLLENEENVAHAEDEDSSQLSKAKHPPMLNATTTYPRLENR